MSEEIKNDVTDTPVSSETPEPTVTETPVSTDWRTSITEELRDDDLIKDLSSLDDLAKGYVHAQRRMGGMVRIPTEDASAEQLEEFYGRLEKIPGVVRVDESDPTKVFDRLGRPENPSDYTAELPEGFNDNGVLDEFKEYAHKSGLTNDQFKAVIEFEKGKVEQHQKAMAESRAQSEKALKEMWGADYSARLDGAKATINVFRETHPDAVEELINGPAGNNPVLLDILSKMGSVLGEQGHPGLEATKSYGTTPQEALDKIDEILGNPSHPYHDKSNPAHDGAVEKVRTLYQLAYPNS